MNKSVILAAGTIAVSLAAQFANARTIREPDRTGGRAAAVVDRHIIDCCAIASNWHGVAPGQDRSPVRHAANGQLPFSATQRQEETGNGYTVNLQMSPASSRLLSRIGEKVTVWASYEGEGKRGAKTDEMGMVNLGSETRIVNPQSQQVVMSGKYNERLAKRSLKGEPQLLINVYSARKAHQNNLLNCGIWQNPVRMAAPGFTIRCKLIEPDATGAQ